MLFFPVGCVFHVGVVFPVGAVFFPVGGRCFSRGRLLSFCGRVCFPSAFFPWALFCHGRSQGEVVEGMCLKERFCMWCVIVVVFAFHMSNYHVNVCLAVWIFIHICIIN